ncbi:glutamate-1-semialdehyde 2,1-aminomutase [Carnobacterium gallinarum]|uniref:glutamate-1-semialdehyde 2,1-aminomutase n=1 Tax=Carnobacterium gallinarum TaxID=2749 RepID=UPI0005598F68|nr:glutamate-1-semialdehyde 2,1-aminomutase [Carnobacterium gallinarum]
MRETKKSEQVFAEALNLMPGGVNSPVRAFKSVDVPPIVMDYGSGSRIFDIDGNSYIDYVLSWGPLILGHAEPHVVAAIQKAASLGTSFGTPTVMENKLAELVIQRVPSIEMVRFVNSGTEATMSALRLARGYTGRDKILKLEGSYHGHDDALLVKVGSGVATLGLPDSPGVPKSTTSNTLVAPYNDLKAVTKVFQEYAGEIAAVIVEPVAGNMGVIPPVSGFLEGLRTLTTNDGALLIFDEVMSGFRVGYHSAQGHFSVLPDLTCLGKVIGGGVPVGAYGGRREIMEQMAPAGSVYQAGTLSGNPIAMAAGYTTLMNLYETDYDHFDLLGDALEIGMMNLSRKYQIPLTVNRAGSMIGLFFNKGPVTNYAESKASDTAFFAKYYKEMADRGIFLPPSQFEGIFLSKEHTLEDIQQTLEAMDASFATLMNK